jgi:hypothetical protein
MQTGSGEAGRASAEAANNNRERAIADAKARLADAESEFAVAQQVAKNKATQDDAAERAKADKKNQPRSSRTRGDGGAAAEAAKEEREATQAILAQYNLRMEEAKGDMRARLEIATQEAAFVKGKYGEQSADYINAQTTIVRIKREAAAQIQQIEEENAKAQDSDKLAAIDDAQADARAQLQAKQITNAQMLELDRQFENQRFAIRNVALARQRAAIDPTRDPVRYAQINAQIATLEQQHQNRMTQIERTAVLQRRQLQMQAGQGLAQSWSQQLAQMATAQQGFMATVRGLWQGLQSVVASVIQQMLEKWIVAQLVKIGLMKVESVAGVSSEVAKAGAGGVASMAAAPFPINLGAPAFGASMAAAAAAFGAVASAEGGDWQVREGLYQLHTDEMVLPAWAASPLRSMITSGNTPSQPANDFGGGNKSTGDIHLNVSAMDVRGVKRFLMDNKEHVAEALRKHIRDGGR